jgi:hypothetical protein
MIANALSNNYLSTSETFFKFYIIALLLFMNAGFNICFEPLIINNSANLFIFIKFNVYIHFRGNYFQIYQKYKFLLKISFFTPKIFICRLATF